MIMKITLTFENGIVLKLFPLCFFHVQKYIFRAEFTIFFQIFTEMRFMDRALPPLLFFYMLTSLYLPLVCCSPSLSGPRLPPTWWCPSALSSPCRSSLPASSSSSSRRGWTKPNICSLSAESTPPCTGWPTSPGTWWGRGHIYPSNSFLWSTLKPK